MGPGFNAVCVERERTTNQTYQAMAEEQGEGVHSEGETRKERERGGVILSYQMRLVQCRD